MKRFLNGGIILFLVSLLCPTLAQAHIIPGDQAGFHHGFMHPFLGLDHVLAMVAVGLWAAQLGGRAIWMVPCSFVGVMMVGGALGVAGVPVPFVETGIMVSIFFLGALILAAVRLPAIAGAAIVGVFALFHGHAHGAEMPATLSGLSYGAGFVLATAILHAAGLALGLLSQRLASIPTLRHLQPVRVAGAIIIVAGGYLALT